MIYKAHSRPAGQTLFVFCVHFGGKLVAVDDKALVRTASYQAAFVSDLKRKHETASVDFSQDTVAKDVHAYRRIGQVLDFYTCTDRALPLLQKRPHADTAGVFKKRNHNRRSEDRRQIAASDGCRLVRRDGHFLMTFDSRIQFHEDSFPTDLVAETASLCSLFQQFFTDVPGFRDDLAYSAVLTTCDIEAHGLYLGCVRLAIRQHGFVD